VGERYAKEAFPFGLGKRKEPCPSSPFPHTLTRLAREEVGGGGGANGRRGGGGGGGGGGPVEEGAEVRMLSDHLLTCPGPKGAEEARAHPSSSFSTRPVSETKQGRATAVVGRGRVGVMPANKQLHAHVRLIFSMEQHQEKGWQMSTSTPKDTRTTHTHRHRGGVGTTNPRNGWGKAKQIQP